LRKLIGKGRPIGENSFEWTSQTNLKAEGPNFLAKREDVVQPDRAPTLEYEASWTGRSQPDKTQKRRADRRRALAFTIGSIKETGGVQKSQEGEERGKKPPGRLKVFF